MPSIFREEEFKICLLCFYIPTCDPWGQFWPQGHMYELGRGPLGDATYKYQSSRPSTFREEKLWNFCSLFLFSTCDPRGVIWTNFKEILCTKYQSCTPSNFREEEFWSFPSLFLCFNSFAPSGIIWTNFVEVHEEKLYTKYKSYKPSSFIEEEFWNFLPMFQIMTSGDRASFDPGGHQMNKFGRDPQGNATYQIWKLYTFLFHRRILKVGFFVPMFQTCDPLGKGSVLTPVASYEQLGRGPQGDARYTKYYSSRPSSF